MPLGTATPGTIPFMALYQPGGLPLAGDERLEIASTGNATSASTFQIKLTDLVGKAPSVMPSVVPSSNDLLAFFQKSSGLPMSTPVGNLGVAFGNLPIGGSTGQILEKNSGTNYDASWSNIAGLLSATTALFVTGSTVAALGVATNAIGNPQIRQGTGLSVVGVAGNVTANVADIFATAGAQFLQTNAAGTGLLFTSVAPSVLPGPYQTGTFTIAGVLYGQGTSVIGVTAAGGTGLPLLAAGGTAAPSFGILTMTGGGFGTATLTVHGVVVGAGTATPHITSTQTAGQLLVGQNVTTDPFWQSVTGDLGLTAAGVATVSNNAITFAKFQQVAGLSVVGVAGNATASVGAITGTSRQLLQVTNATTLAFTTLPIAAVTSFLTGNGTFTTPTNALYLEVQLVGPSGGGGGSGTGASAGGAATGSTSFSSGGLVLIGGSGTPGTVNSTLAAGGTASGGDINLAGGGGAPASVNATSFSGQGGASFFGGAGPGNPPGGVPGNTPAANSGSGASGGSSGTTGPAGGGSAAGGYVYKMVLPPLAANYTWTIGLGGTAGTAGTQGIAGAAGSNGLIIVKTYFQ